MTHIISSRYFRVLTVISIAVSILVSSLPAWATDEEATKEVVAMKTEHKWFYWPGWAFVALVILVIGLVLFGWYKSVLGPKYRGSKVVQ